MPASSIAAILESASPLPPEMIAPAWPMRRPGGAVRPAMKPTIGLLQPRRDSSLMKLCGVFFRGTANLANHDDGFRRGIGQE